MFLVGRVDEREPALLGRRQEGAERLEAVAAVHADARVAVEFVAQALGFSFLQFAERRAIAGAQQRRLDQRRARIGAQLPAGVHAAHDLEVARERRMLRCGLRGEQPADAVLRFAAARAELVAAATRMRVEQEERAVLFREPQERGDERDVLRHVGEVAGMKGVPVLHASPSQSRGRRYSARSDASAEPGSGVQPYSQRASGGSDIRMDSARPPVCRPKSVPRSWTRLNST